MGGMKFWASAGLWEPEVEAKVDNSDSTLRLDLQADAKLSDDPGAVAMVEFAFMHPGGVKPPARYNFGFWTLNQRETNDVGLAGFGFDGKSFTGQVRTRFKASNYYFSGEAPSQTSSGQYVGGMFGIHLLHMQTELDEILGGDSAEESKWVPMPVLGVRCEAGLGQGFSFYTVIEGMSLAIFEIDSFDAEFYHIDAGLKLDLAKNASLSGGYKTWKFKVGLDDDYVKMELDGATLNFTFKW